MMKGMCGMKTLDEIEAAAKAATQGRWDSFERHVGIDGDYADGHPTMAVATAVIHSLIGTGEAEANAHHIATSNPETILVLCADLRACREALSNASLGLDVLGYAHSLWKSGLEVALKNLEKWGI